MSNRLAANSGDVVERPAGFFSDEMTSLDLLEMYFVNFDAFSQY
mgnify:CR=1 FL=1